MNANQIRELFALPDHADVHVEISWDLNRFGEPCEADKTLAGDIHACWWHVNTDPDTDRVINLSGDEASLSWTHAPTELADIINKISDYLGYFDLADEETPVPDWEIGPKGHLLVVTVNGWSLPDTLKAAA